MTLTRRRLAGLVCVSLAVAGCSSPHSPTANTDPVARSASPPAATTSPVAGPLSVAPTTAAVPPAASPATVSTAVASGPPVDSDQQIPSPFGAPTDDAQSHTAAVAAATTAMTAFTRTALPYATWYAQLMPLLSVTAAQAYAGTIPANIPAHTLTGPAKYVASSTSTAYLARVSVPTNVGVYVVLLSRVGAGMGWLVERFTSPPGVGR